MRKKMLAILIALLSGFTISNAQVQEAWINNNVGDFFDDTDDPALVLDKNENIILGINTRVPNFDSDVMGDELSTFHLSKFTPDGTLVFEILESVSSSGQKNLVGIAVDNAGNIYCAVRLWRVADAVTPRLAGLFAVYKYNSSGGVVWKRTYGDGENSFPTSIAVDAAGNVYLTGGCKESGLVQNNQVADYLTVKWNSGGDLQWARRYDAASPGEGFNVAQDIIVDGSGNVYITGFSQLNGELGYGTIKYNASGTALWIQRYTGTGSDNDIAAAITRDISGFIYVTGNSEGTIATIKYNNDGAQLWVQRKGTGGATARDIKVDAFGAIYVAGNITTSQAALMKYRFDGVELWTQLNNGTFQSMALDAGGNIYVSGTESSKGLTKKYNTAGISQWTKTYESIGNPGINNPIAVFNSNENVYTLSFTWLNCSGCGTPRYVAKLIKYTQCNIVCPQDITVNNDPGKCNAVVTFNDVTLSGDCGPTLTYSHASGNEFPVGVTTVTVTSDATGASCSFKIRVVDNEKPVVKCKNVTVQLDANGNGTLTAAQVDNGSTDNCGISSRSISKTNFNCTDVGANTITFTVTDIYGNTSSCNATVTVQDITLPNALCRNITAYLDEAGSVSITAADVDNGSSDACGPVTLSLSKTVYTCADKGENFPVLTVTDPNNNSATCTPTVTVLDTLPPVIASVVATPESLWPSDRKMKSVTLAVTATDNCGVYTWRISDVVIKSGMFENDQINPDYLITGDHTVNLRAEIPKKGIKRVYTVIITCTDASGNSSTSSTDVAVSHNITAPRSGAITLIGTTLNLTGEFWDLPGNTHTAKWVIDENSTARAMVVEPSENNNGTVSGTYKFTNAGVYKLKMLVTDQNGQTRFANTNENLDAFVVVYDPNGGYTYGGGNFYSAPGALRINPESTGDVSYGFTVNYYKGAKLPKGETQFEFKLGDFEFNALNFDYLVINKSMAQFRGTGKIIGGQSGVGFTMTVIDGQLDGSGVDKIRMKIFNKNTGEVIYDNQPGAGDAELPRQPVGANSVIVIGGGTKSSSAATSELPVVQIERNLHTDRLEAGAFPNPHNGTFTLKVQSPKTGKMTIEYFTVTGARIYQFEQQVKAHEQIMIPNTGFKFSGTIFYKVSIDGMIKTGKVIGIK